jgi:uncharacterized iron-regulated membrane protein
MALRKVLFWMHLAAGCIAGAVVLVMSVTGVLLTYERQMLASAERGVYKETPRSGAARLTMDELLERLSAVPGGLGPNRTVVVRSEAAAPIELSLGREGSLFASPYDGRILGRGNSELRQSFQKITAWHRWLGREGEGREVAKAITGASNLAFLFLVVSGIYLWLPKVWSGQHLRPIVWFRGGMSGKARDFNWHNTFGLWASFPLLIIVASAVPMSYGWGNRLVYWVTGSEAPAAPAERGQTKSGVRKQAGRRTADAGGTRYEGPSLNRSWEQAEQQTAGWKSISMRLPEKGATEVSMTVDTGNGGQPQKRETLLIETATGQIKKRERYEDGSAGRRLRTWSRFTHTGEYYGVIGQTIAGGASLAGAMLVWTGLSLSLRRWTAWRRRR